jgi:hypothetical protein
MNDEDERVQVDRLGDVVVGSHLHGFDGGLDGTERSDDDDGGLQAFFTDAPEEFKAGSRHAEIGDDELRVELFEDGPGFVAIVRERNLVANLFQLHLHDAAEAAVIIDHEDAAGLHRAAAFVFFNVTCAARAGNSSRKVVPRSEFGRQVSVPPCLAKRSSG